MLRHEDNIASRLGGNNLQPLAGISVTVTDNVTGLPASLYDDALGTVPLAQPRMTDENGYYGFNAPDGSYTMTFTGVRVAPFTRQIVLDDPKDNPYATKAELAAGSGSTLMTFTQAGTGAVPRPLQDELRERVSVKQFGAVGDGVTNDTAAIQAALNYAALAKVGVEINGTYIVNTVRVKNGTTRVFGRGTLKAATNAGEAVLELDGPWFGAGNAPVSYCEISGITIDCNGVTRRGIFGSASQACRISGVNIKGLSNSSLSETGIFLHFDSVNNFITNNTISLEATGAASLVGVHLVSSTVDVYAGWMTGSFQLPTQVTARNTVQGNKIIGGTHGIAMHGSWYNNIVGNILQGSEQRGIIMSPSSSYNLVEANTVLDFGSSGVHMAYNSSNNTVVGNTLQSLGSHGEAGIQSYVGCSANNILNNRIACASNYGVYLAVQATLNTVSGNIINGSQKRAGIALESDWESPLPALALYSRPNFGPPVAPRTDWASENTFGNTITNNVINDAPAGTCAIYISQVGPTYTCEQNTIRGNTANGSLCDHLIYFYEESAGKNSNNVLQGNNLPAVSGKIFFSNGRAHFSICELVGNKSFADAPANSASPSVATADYISTATYSAPTNVTNFTGGMDGQEIVVRLSVNTTIVNNDALIRTKGGANIVGTNSNNYIMLKRMTGIWFEMWRNF